MRTEIENMYVACAKVATRITHARTTWERPACKMAIDDKVMYTSYTVDVVYWGLGWRWSKQNEVTAQSGPNKRHSSERKPRLSASEIETRAPHDDLNRDEMYMYAGHECYIHKCVCSI